MCYLTIHVRWRNGPSITDNQLNINTDVFFPSLLRMVCTGQRSEGHISKVNRISVTYKDKEGK